MMEDLFLEFIMLLIVKAAMLYVSVLCSLIDRRFHVMDTPI